jgi:predicted nucleic acid-binding Zn ribbon protein
MRPIQEFGAGVLAQLIRHQPPSPARTDFAWQLAVGPVLARVTTVSLDGDVLKVKATDARWLKEIERARPALLPKLQQLLGESAVRKITTT